MRSDRWQTRWTKFCFSSLQGGWISNKGSLPASSRESAASCPTELPAAAKPLPCPSADNNSQGCSTYLEGYSMYSWELSQTKHPQTYHYQKEVWFGNPKISTWSSWMGRFRRFRARENLPSPSQTCNIMSKADKISAVDKVSRVKYPSLVQKLSACSLIQCLIRKKSTSQ